MIICCIFITLIVINFLLLKTKQTLNNEFRITAQSDFMSWTFLQRTKSFLYLPPVLSKLNRLHCQM